MPFLILSLLIQVALVIHILKSGRNTTWIWVVVMLPLAGSIAYLILEILPEFAGSRTGRKAQRKIKTMVNPDGDLRQATDDYAVADTIDNAKRLADALIEKNLFADARDLYQKCLKGAHQHDAYLMFGLAKAEFSLGNHAQVKHLLDDLIKHNPDFKNAEAHLLYARTLEQLNDTAGALHEYAALDQYYPGPEATFHYAMLLKRHGDEAKAQQLLGEILAKAKRLGRHYNELHQPWVRKAAQEYNHKTTRRE